MRHLIGLFILFISSSVFCQTIQDEMVSMQLHLNVKSSHPERSLVQNLRDEQARAMNIPEFLAVHQEDEVRIFGSRKNVKDIVSYQFESNKLEDNGECNSYCEKIVSIEKLPYLGLGVEPMPDFTGVLVDRIIDDESAAHSELETGDIITSIQALEISTACDLTGAVNAQDVEDFVAVEYIRDGRPKKTYIKIGYRIKKNVTWVKCCESESKPVDRTFDNLSLAVFPNPSDGITQFNFLTSNISSAQLVLTDMTGRNILNKTIYPLDGFLNDYLDLSRIASGVYLLNIIQDGKTVSEKIVLQRD